MDSVQLFSQLLCFTSLAAVTAVSLQSKHLIRFTGTKKWNEARHVCLTAGGDLAYIDNYTTQYLLQAFDNDPVHNIDNIWIGLHDVAMQTGSVGTQGFRWTTGPFLDATDWSNWQAQEPQQRWNNWCVRLQYGDSLTWFPEQCLSPNHYLCQIDTGPCTNFTHFKAGRCDVYHASATLSPITLLNVTTRSQCQTLCLDQDDSQTSGLCWMYGHTGTECVLFTGSTPVFCGGSDPPSALEEEFMARDCYSITYNTSTFRTPSINGDKPQVDYSFLSTTSAPENTTPQQQTSESSSTMTTSSLPLTSFQTTEKITSASTSMAVTLTTELTLLPTTENTTPQQHTSESSSTMPTSPGLLTSFQTTEKITSESTSIEHATTPEQQTSLSSSMMPTSPRQLTSFQTTERVPSGSSSVVTTASPDEQHLTAGTNYCACSCHHSAVTEVTTVMKEAERLQRELTLNRTTLSSSRRRKESAPDNRASAQAAGVLGVLVLVFLACVIVLPDLKIFVQAIYSRYVQRRQKIGNRGCAIKHPDLKA